MRSKGFDDNSKDETVWIRQEARDFIWVYIERTPVFLVQATTEAGHRMASLVTIQAFIKPEQLDFYDRALELAKDWLKKIQ